jgi:hypothetical protein
LALVAAQALVLVVAAWLLAAAAGWHTQGRQR